jgi:hypothetical protein
MKQVSIFLIVVALIVGMIGCGGESYDLVISSTEGGSVTSPGEGTFTYDERTVIQLIAEVEVGYRFVNWIGDVSTIANVDTAATNITMNGSYVITANFVAVYNLAISSTKGGSVTSPGEGTFTYDEGTVVDLTADAEEGYYFDNWSGNASTIVNMNYDTTTITINDDYSITANFQQIPPGQFSLTIHSTTGGVVTSPGEGTSTYDGETVVNLVAEAEESYRFINWTGDVGTVTNANAAVTTITMNDNYSISANFGPEYSPIVATGWAHTVGVKSDGSVIAVGDNDWGQCDVSDWTAINQVAAGYYHTVGLESDGTVVATGWNDHGQCDLGDWIDINQVAAGYYHTVGLKSDGTVITVGSNDYGQCDVGDWMDIVQVAAGGVHTVGVKCDGTVVAEGDNTYGQCEVGDWTQIVQVSAGRYHTVGFKTDGTVVAVGRNAYGQCDVGSWTDITLVATVGYHTVGCRLDGNVVAAGDNNFGQCDVGDWTDINQIAAGGHHTVGLKSNGAVVAVGWNDYGQCDIGGWDLIP